MEADTKAFWEKDAAEHMGFAYQYGKNPDVRYPMYEVRRNLVFETLNAMPRTYPRRGLRRGACAC
jgi:hypothetical protein